MKHFIAIPLLFLALCGFSQEKADSSRQKPVCPVCKSHNMVVPIVYGKPMAATVKRAEKGEIRLGGCMVSTTSPRNYCKKDQLEF
jgi:hypothetical protein